MERLKSSSDLEKLRKSILAKKDPKKPGIAICVSTGCEALGVKEVLKALKEELKKQNLGIGGELWLTDAITQAAKNGARFLVHKVEGEWLTTGDPIRYMKTQVRFALERKDIGEEFKNFLKSLRI